MNPSLFPRLSDVFSKAQLILFLNDVAPGTSAAQTKRQGRPFPPSGSFHSSRFAFWSNPDGLGQALDDLDGPRDFMFTLLETQNLIVDGLSLTIEDHKKYVINLQHY